MKEATAGFLFIVLIVIVGFGGIWAQVAIIDYRVKLGTDRLIECLENSLSPKECK